MKKISLQNFIIVFFAFHFLLVGAFVSVLVFQIKSRNEVKNFEYYFNEAFLSWNRATYSQHNFFMEYKDDLVFYQTEQSKYLKRSSILISEAQNVLDSLIGVPYSFNYKMDDKLQLYNDNLVKIEDIFEEIAHLLFIRGSNKTGIIGNCASLYELSLNSVTDKNLKNLLMESNVAYLNYLNSPGFGYYEDFLNCFTSMGIYLKKYNVSIDTINNDSVRITPFYKGYSPEFIGYVNDYKQAFGKLLSIDKKLFLNEQANLMEQWILETHEFKELFLELRKVIHDNTEKKIKEFSKISIIGIIVLLSSFLIVFFVVLRVPKKIKELQTSIEPIKEGVIPDFKFDIKMFSEIVEISESLNRVIELLRNTSEFANQIGQGNFDFKYSPAGAQDELGNSLILLRDNLAKSQKDDIKRSKEDKIREWTNTGIAKFSDILRQSTKDIVELSRAIIKEIVNYLDANQGGIFVLNDENKDNVKLELTSSYAYSKERKKKKVFLMGEGLVGTCAVEKATIYMTEVPEDYISITSGLGGANPKSLLIVPLKHEERVLGIIEIASFNELEKYKIQFVEKIAESIASSLSVTKINERTTKLLETAKLEADQRLSKENELKQNLEKLRVIQENASARENELNTLLTLINKVAYVLELDTNGNITTVPASFCRKYKLDKNQIIGHHLSEFDFSSESKLKEDDFWNKLLNGKDQIYQRKYTLSNYENLWFDDYIMPFIDANSNVVKLICVSTDVTEKIKENEKLQEITNKLRKQERETIIKAKEIEKAKEIAEKEKKDALEMAKKLENSKDVISSALKRNEIQLTKIKNNYKSLKILQDKTKVIFHESINAIQIIKNNYFIECNQATLDLFKFKTIEEFCNTHPSEVSPPLQPDGEKSESKANTLISRALEEESVTFEWMHRKSDGTDFKAKVTIVSYIVQGDIYIYALIKDLTDKENSNLE